MSAFGPKRTVGPGQPVIIRKFLPAVAHEASTLLIFHMPRVLIWVLILVAVPTVVWARTSRFQSKQLDGSPINWTLDRPSGANSSGLLILAQGSGCLSAERDVNLDLARAAFSSFAVVRVEKYGVNPGDNPKDDVGDCSEAFRDHFTVSQRVEDYLTVIQSLRSQTWWNGKLILLGGSEGGAVSARLAAPSGADAVILISTGGDMTFGQMVSQSIQQNLEKNRVPKGQWPPLEEIFNRARANPESSERFAGYPLRFWADAIDQRPLDEMLKSRAPILLIQGDSDDSTPVEASRSTRVAFKKAGRCNLTYWEMHGYDHGMVDGSGKQHMSEVLANAAQWAKDRMMESNKSRCMGP